MMSRLDVWLSIKFQLSRADLILDIRRIVENASRYSKEHTLPKRQSLVSVLFGNEDVVRKFAEDWVNEVERSIQEDEEGVYREGEDMQIANAIAESRVVLRKLGDKAPLDAFPFGMISECSRQFFCRALQKELSVSLKRLGKIDYIEGALVYTDDRLTGILQAEFEGR